MSDKIYEVPAEWTKRAAALRPMDPRAYSNDKAFMDAVMSLTAVDAETHLKLEQQCTDRLKAADAKR